jgi:hypothetical protein
MRKIKSVRPEKRIISNGYGRERVELMIQDDESSNAGRFFGPDTVAFFSAGEMTEAYRYDGRTTPYDGETKGAEVVAAIHPDPMKPRAFVVARYAYYPSVRFGGTRAKCDFVFLGRE